MVEHVCAFSGIKIPQGRGIYKVKNDSKLLTVWGNRELNYIKKKISPKSVKWTLPSRAFLNKKNKEEEKKVETVKVNKGNRGLYFVPSSLISNKKDVIKEYKK